MFKIRTLRELYSKLRNDEKVAEKIRTIGRVKSFKSEKKDLILQDLKERGFEIKATFRRGTSEANENNLQGLIVRTLLISNGKKKNPKFSVYSLKVINSFELKQYQKILREERKINRLLDSKG